jgi:hypothetical protein
MEAVYTSETSVYVNETTRRYIPQSCHLHTRGSENLKSHRVLLLLALVIHSFTGAYSPGWTFGLPFWGFFITHIQTHGTTPLDDEWLALVMQTNK